MMFSQRNSKTNVGCIRPNRKCFSFSGSLIFLLILMVAIAPEPATAGLHRDKDLPPQPFDANDDFKDVDNLEIHPVKLVDGVTQEDHPTIIYKEDFVTADYVPPLNGTKSEKHKRRSKDVRQRKRHTKQHFNEMVLKEKPDTILFDVIPEQPIIVSEDTEKPKTSHLKLEPLITDSDATEPTEGTESPATKEELHKRPKKYHQRVRRNANGEHLVHKRNPYFRHVPKVSAEMPTQQVQYTYVKHSVPGKKHNGLDIPVPGPRPKPTMGPTSFDNRIAADENDRVIFSSGRRTTSRPAAATESIFRDPRPENFDFSFMNNQRPAAATTARTPIFNRRSPANRQQPTTESIFRDPRPENFDFSFMNPQGQASSLATIRTPAAAATARPQPPTQAAISQCVWAIVNCCSNRNTDIRYNCFEQNGCYGAFWGLNPCAEPVRDNLVNIVADYYN